MKNGIKQKYVRSAFFMLVSAVIVKVISAFYKIPLTSYIGAQGRGYFSIAYNLCMPFHALTMGAFPVAVTKLISSANAKNEYEKIQALRKASSKMFFRIGFAGMTVMMIVAVPYANIISSSPNSLYTIFALAPSVFFSCLCACRRSWAEGFLDMKATAVSQLIEAGFKLVFGLLLARVSMTYFINLYEQNHIIFGQHITDEAQALAVIYPYTSAFAMLGATLGGFASYIFSSVYVNVNYKKSTVDKRQIFLAYKEIWSFSIALVGATAIQSIMNFADTSSLQLCLSHCSDSVLSSIYNYNGDDVYSYVFGLYATALDFKNLIPSIVMALGVTAVPAVSSAYENSSERFTTLINSILKYSVIITLFGSLFLTLFSSEILNIIYGSSNPDIAQNSVKIMTILGATVFPCAVSTTVVYCAQALGLAGKSIPSFIVAGVVRVVANMLFVTNDNINISGSGISCLLGFSVILIWNIVIISTNTKVKFSLSTIFFKPFLCLFIDFAVTKWCINNIKIFSTELYDSMFCIIICAVSYATLLIVTKAVSIKELKSIR